MGYYTDFTITTDSNAIITDLICTALSEISGYEFEDGMITRIISHRCQNSFRSY